MIKLVNISKSYNMNKSNEARVLQSVSLTVEQGDMVGIIGPSGVGKSTLLHILACIDTSDTGEYWLFDKLITGLNNTEYSKIRNTQIGIVLQEFALVEEITVMQNVIIPMIFGKRIGKKAMRQKAESVLDKVGILELKNQPVWSLSGGQKQRTAIARAIINEPKLILADEPTGALDEKTTHDIVQLFARLNTMGQTIIIITHDPIVAKACRRTISMSRGALNEIDII